MVTSSVDALETEEPFVEALDSEGLGDRSTLATILFLTGLGDLWDALSRFSDLFLESCFRAGGTLSALFPDIFRTVFIEDDRDKVLLAGFDLFWRNGMWLLTCSSREFFFFKLVIDVAAFSGPKF